jgi:carboxypeptidase PM20D1
MVALYIILALIIAFLAVILIRAAMFRPPSEKERKPEEINFDGDAAVTALQELVRCRTVSYHDPSLEDDAEFEKLVGLLPKLYPEVARVCTMTRLPGRALLFKWEGEEHGEPSVLMAHYDVVPVNEESWTKPPFDAVIDENGVLWGRGCLDTKHVRCKSPYCPGIQAQAGHIFRFFRQRGGFRPGLPKHCELV